MTNFAVDNAIITSFEMEKHNFVTIANLSREEILYLITMAQEFEKHPNR